MPESSRRPAWADRRHNPSRVGKRTCDVVRLCPHERAPCATEPGQGPRLDDESSAQTFYGSALSQIGGCPSGNRTRRTGEADTRVVPAGRDLRFGRGSSDVVGVDRSVLPPPGAAPRVGSRGGVATSRLYRVFDLRLVPRVAPAFLGAAIGGGVALDGDLGELGHLLLRESESTTAETQVLDTTTAHLLSYPPPGRTEKFGSILRTPPVSLRMFSRVHRSSSGRRGRGGCAHSRARRGAANVLSGVRDNVCVRTARHGNDRVAG